MSIKILFEDYEADNTTLLGNGESPIHLLERGSPYRGKRGTCKPFLNIVYRKARSPSSSKIMAMYKITIGITKPPIHELSATPSGSAIAKSTTITQNSGAHFPTTISLTEVLPVEFGAAAT